MRKAMVGVGLLLVLLCVTDVAAEGYRVILKNGSWVQAWGKPEADGSNVRIRLSGGGVAVIPHASIDWEATEKGNKPREEDAPLPAADLPPTAAEVPSGTITLVGDKKEAASGEEVAAPADEAADTELSPPDDVGEDDGLRRRIRFLNAEITKLRQEKAQLDSQAASSINLDQAKVLRGKSDNLVTRIQSLEAERTRITTRLSQQQQQQQ